MKEGIKSTKSTWNDIIASKLKAGVTLQDLKAEYDSGIIMDPNVVSDDISGLDHNITNAKPWINMATISAENAADINRLALLALNQGANGLDLRLMSEMNIKSALDTIMTEYLDVRISCIGWTEEKIEEQKKSLSAQQYPNLRWIDNDSNYTELEISSSERVQSIKGAIDKISADKQYDIVVKLSKNLLFEISSLRALRLLLQDNNNINILAKYEVEGTNQLGDYDLIERSYKVMSGIMGCADTILTTYDGDEASRLALNIHNVLELESGFKNVLDPVGGSYYIEKLTGEIIEAVQSNS